MCHIKWIATDELTGEPGRAIPTATLVRGRAMAHKKYLVTRTPEARLTGLVFACGRFASTITRTRIRLPGGATEELGHAIVVVSRCDHAAGLQLTTERSAHNATRDCSPVAGWLDHRVASRGRNQR
jgi:hypothetical protein